MPTAPKPAPPPAAKLTLVPAQAPASSTPIPDGWAVFFRLTFHKEFTNAQLIEAIACDDRLNEVTTGPLLVQPEPGAIRAAMDILREIIAGHIAAATLQPPTPAATPLPLQQDTRALAPTPVAPAATAETQADPERIAQIQSAITALPPDWQTYVLGTFRAEFNLPDDQKISTRIKSVRHCDFIAGLLPS